MVHMNIKKIYKTHNYYKQFKNNKNKWQSIKHRTSNKYIHALHGTIEHRECNFTIFGSVWKYTSKVIM